MISMQSLDSMGPKTLMMLPFVMGALFPDTGNVVISLTFLQSSSSIFQSGLPGLVS